MNQEAPAAFGPWRRYIWPIHRHELATVLPMMAILFLTCFGYGILKNLKDAVVVTAKSSGAEVIPFLKVWAILPAALLSTWLYTRMTSRWGQEKTYYVIVSSFLVYFMVFSFVLYPNREALHPHDLADWLSLHMPRGLQGLVALFRNWTYTTFYVMSELWASLILSVMFWAFANQITAVKEARRFYGVLALASNGAAVAAGHVGLRFTFRELQDWIPFGSTAWEQTLEIITLSVVISGIIMMALYRWMAVYTLQTDTRDTVNAKKVKKPKLSFVQSFHYLAASPYIRNIGMLIIGYNLTINLVEVIWKDQLRVVYPNPSDYNAYMSALTFYMGLFATSSAFVIAPMIKRWGWGLTAAITPVMMLITSAGFFLCLFMGEVGPDSALFLGSSAPMLAVLFGAAQNCLSKACKYSVFDTTKEMAFIPLDPEAKLAGKAAIDGVGSRVAKSGSSACLQGLLIPCGSLAACAPLVSLVVIGVTLAWLRSVRALSKQFKQLTEQPHLDNPEDEKETDSENSTSAVAV